MNLLYIATKISIFAAVKKAIMSDQQGIPLNNFNLLYTSLEGIEHADGYKLF